MDIGIMIEGQNGLNWTRWERIAKAVQDLGFSGLFRSDHYTNANPPDKDSLELWVSLTWLASHTEGIDFGPLVSPLSFRQPTMIARMAGAVDDLSGGRLRLGLGAGWQEREHANYGWDLLDVKERMDRFEEGLGIVSHLLRDSEPLTFNGEYFTTKDAVLLPRPSQAGGPPIVVGGNGPNRTLALAARYANEWNGVLVSPERFAALNELLDQHTIKVGRQPEEIRRSIMVGTIFARYEEELNRKLSDKSSWFYGRKRDALRERGIIVGLPRDFREQLKRYEESGAQQIMLQWLDLDDLEGLESLALEII